MDKILKKQDLIDELANRTGFYKYNIETFLTELENLVIDVMQDASIDDNMEMKLIPGITIGARRVAPREVRNPRDNTTLMAPERIIPYAKFSQFFRYKINGE